jgi:3alpha(or 20beta)-hydroxysteroid dehydrogenase
MGQDVDALHGRIAVVTGAAQGIGEATAQRLVQAGAHVLLTDIRDDDGSLVAQALGQRARYVRLDVRCRKDWERTVLLCVETFGGSPTILIHNAGVMTPGSVESTDEEELRMALDINLFGAVIGTQVCLPGMIEAGGGSVVVVSSIASMAVGPGFIPYAVSKAANAAYARAAAREVGRYGIRVNSLHPGGVETPMNSGPDFADLDKDAWFSRMTIPRIGRVDEIAAAAMFLASDESSYVTGTQLIVDGGQLLGPADAWRADTPMPADLRFQNQE